MEAGKAMTDLGNAAHEAAKNWDGDKIVGEFPKISKEAQAGIDEMTEAFNGFATLINGIRGHEFPDEYYKVKSPRETILHRKAKEKRAKRKRGGKK